MSLIDIKSLQDEARQELNEEVTKAAKAKLKELYRTREKAVLALKNIDREIQSYLDDVSDTMTYAGAGVDTGK